MPTPVQIVITTTGQDQLAAATKGLQQLSLAARQMSTSFQQNQALVKGNVAGLNNSLTAAYEGGLKMEDGFRGAGAGALSFGGSSRQLNLGLRALSDTVRVFSYDLFPRSSYWFYGLTSNMKFLNAAGLLTSGTMVSLAAGISALIPVITTASQAWQIYTNKVKAASYAQQSAIIAGNVSQDLRKQIVELQKAGRLTPETANDLDKQVEAAQLKLANATKELTTPISKVEPVYSSFGLRLNPESIIKAQRQGAVDAAEKELEALNRIVSAQVLQLQTTKDQETAAQSLRDLQQKILTDRLEGFDKEREAAQQAHRQQLDDINANAQKAGAAVDSRLVQSLLDTADADLRRKQDEINAREDAQREQNRNKLKLALATATNDRTAVLALEEQAALNQAEKDFTITRDLEEAKTQIATTYAAKRQQLRQSEFATDAAARLQSLTGAANGIAGNLDLTNNERAAQLLANYRLQTEELKRQQAIWQGFATGPALPGATAEAQQHLADISAELVTIQNQMEKLSLVGTFGGEFVSEIRTLRAQWGGFAHDAAQTFGQVFQSGIQSISDGISGLILRTKTWRQALSEIGTALVTEVVSGIVKVFVTWIAQTLILRGLQRLIGLETNTQAASAATSWAPAAIAASISSYGGAAGVGLAAYLAAITAGTLATGAAGGGLAARATGGPVTAGQPYIVGERRPELFVPGQSGFILPSVPRALDLPAPAAAGGAPAAAPTNIHFAGIMDSEALAIKGLSGRRGKKFLLDFNQGTVKEITGRA